MDSFTLKRTSKTIMGVFGVLLDEHGWIVCCTAERPDLDNKQSVSCIPEGEYQCVKHVSPSKGKCISIKDVKGRTDVLIHVGNYPMIDSEGCILAGNGFGNLNNQPAVTSSRDAMARLMDMADDEFTLIIEDVS